MQPGDVVRTTNVGEICVRSTRCSGCKKKRDARPGSCVQRSQLMITINQVMLFGRAGGAVWREVSWATGDMVLPSGHSRLDTGDKGLKGWR